MRSCTSTTEAEGWRHAQLVKRPRIVQQLSRALCVEFAVRRKQGRDATVPRWFELSNFNCSTADAYLEDVWSPGENPAVSSVHLAAEAAPLFERLVNALHEFVGDLESATALLNSKIDEADGKAVAVYQAADGFTLAFKGVAATFGDIDAYVAASADIFTLREDIRSLDRTVKGWGTIFELHNLRDSIIATVKRANRGTSPFECATPVESCERVVGREKSIMSEAAELAYATSLPYANVAVTMLTGLGDGLCLLRTGSYHAYVMLESLTYPLEELVEVLTAGPSSVKGLMPMCREGDLFCLNKVSRSSIIHRFISFPLKYMHFMDLGGNAMFMNPMLSGPPTVRRFTIPGLWSKFSMQSSTFLNADWPRQGALKNMQFGSLLSFAPATPGGCTPDYISLLVSTAPFGNIVKIHGINDPQGKVYAGSLTGLAVARSDRRVYACGKEYDKKEYSLFVFNLADVDVKSINPKTERDIPRKDIQMCQRIQVSGIRGTTGKERCLLSWDAETDFLWIGNTAQPGESGKATAFKPPGCSGGLRPVGRELDLGEHASAFSFMKDYLGLWVSIPEIERVASLHYPALG